MSSTENAKEIVQKYAEEILAKFHTGQAREHAYRPDFEAMMRLLDPSVRPINDPAASQNGRPDFVYIRNGLTVGYAETKDVGIDLDKVEKTNQMDRYLGYSSLILTDYLSFRFFKNGQRQGEEICIGKIRNGHVEFTSDQFATLADALRDFLKGEPEPIRSGKQLSEIMGGKARRIRDNVKNYLAKEDERNEELHRVYETIKRLLVHDLTIEAFADMYAQTLVYGLFVARHDDETPKSFTRQEARDLIPASNPFLREFFDHIAGPRFDARLQFIVDELCAVFAVSDVKTLVQKHLRLFEVQGEKDPIIHFYEDFLSEYDGEQRKKMGAYYTPIPVARFIIRAVDSVLKEHFGLEKGLADASKRKVSIVSQGKKVDVDMHRVQILDPAVGTATFLNETVKYIQNSFVGQEGRWASYVQEDLLPRLHGFELMMAPYTIAHLKLGMTLRESGVKDFSKRLGVYLTNTLEEGSKTDDSLFAGLGLSHALAQEAELAGKIKNERPIMVVIGNPPYSGVSSNETEYANSLIEKYKVEPGGKQKLQERKHWLNDDYVKFIAFAEDLIEKNGEGIVAMITNHGYLDNPTFRGMRWHLAQTFDSIHVLDLHGNTKKKETAPDGGKDENVFDIQQGVAIIVAAKQGKKKSGESARVFHADLFGKRREKFAKLENSDVDWKEISLDDGSVFFAPKELEGLSEYRDFVAVDELFPINVSGILTARDGVVIEDSKKALLDRMNRFIDQQYSDDETRIWLFPGKKNGKYPAGDSRGWKLPIARKAVALEDREKMIKEINYRPFDRQFIYYSPAMVDWGRFEIMSHFLKGENLGLLFSRMTKGKPFAHAFITDRISEVIYLSPLTGTNAFNAPLYLYHEDGTKTPNIDSVLLKKLCANLSVPYDPEYVFDYIYAILHSPKYRETYREFLKIDFPRVPPPENDEQFHRLARFGKDLRELHLMKSPKLNQLVTSYPIGGSNFVEKVEYKDGNVSINNEQYFGNAPEIAWNFYIGGYQPAQKWLKDRKGRVLTNEEIEHYQKVITALVETDRVMKQIDTASNVSKE